MTIGEQQLKEFVGTAGWRALEGMLLEGQETALSVLKSPKSTEQEIRFAQGSVQEIETIFGRIAALMEE